MGVVKVICVAVQNEIDSLKRYEDFWPIRNMIVLHLRKTSTEARKKKAGATNLRADRHNHAELTTQARVKAEGTGFYKEREGNSASEQWNKRFRILCRLNASICDPPKLAPMAKVSTGVPSAFLLSDDKEGAQAERNETKVQARVRSSSSSDHENKLRKTLRLTKHQNAARRAKSSRFHTIHASCRQFVTVRDGKGRLASCSVNTAFACLPLSIG
ncbi:hypothetical protein NMY22_g18301 [Coprinellus aureogranulatus]|nr:hypothetical protein NMY22_g18301 [Coprinellus aureogranulatus]